MHTWKRLVSSRHKNEFDKAGPGASKASEKDGLFGMKILVDKPPDQPNTTDIVAIHGLNGHYIKTWSGQTPSGEDVNWLKDFLPAHIPNARIMSYSYNSTLQFSKSLAGIEVFAGQLLEDLMSWRTSPTEKGRDVIFICHSLGGLVFKQALNIANERGRYSMLLSHIKGVAFFGTPHRGSDLAQWAQMLGNILKVASFGTNTNTRLADELKSGSEVLRKISSSFVERGKNLTIFSFYETEMMPNMNCKVVDEDSAVLNLPNETCLGMNGNHRSICRFSSPEDPGFRRLWTNLKSIITPTSDQDLTDEEKSCLLKLYTSDYESHKRRNDPPTPGTCLWLLDHHKYKEWQESTTSTILWISADPGCGKSVLTSFLVDRQHSKHYDTTINSQANLCYFFFKDDNEDQRTAVHGISAILHQIYSTQPQLLKHALREQAKKGVAASKQFYTLWHIFKETVEDSSSNDTVCFIDGLDECEESSRELLARALAEYFSENQIPRPGKPKFKLLITSRPNNSIKSAFHNMLDIRLKGEDETESISNDIELVVHAHIKELQHSDLPAEILTNLHVQLVKRADRTFLWTTLIIKLLKDALRAGASEKELNAILESRDIDEVYTRLLQNSRFPSDARKMLHIIIAAARPLSLDEMSIAMSFWSRQNIHPAGLHDLTSDGLIPKNRHNDDWAVHLPSTHDEQTHGETIESLDELSSNLKRPFDNYVYTLCGHFLRIIRGKIYLVHQTAREFLLFSPSSAPYVAASYVPLGSLDKSSQTVGQISHSNVKKKAKNDIWQHSISLVKAHTVLLDICRDYLWLFSLLPERTKKESLGAKYDDFCRRSLVRGFLRYVAVYWPLHFREVRVLIRPQDLQRYEVLCDPRFPAFKIWTSHHPSFEANFPGDMYIPGSKSEETQDILAFFDLDKTTYELNSLTENQDFQDMTAAVTTAKDEESEGEISSGAESSEARMLKPNHEISHRIQRARRIEERNIAQFKLEPGTVGLSHPAAGHSFPIQRSTDGSLPPSLNRSLSSKHNTGSMSGSGIIFRRRQIEPSL